MELSDYVIEEKAVQIRPKKPFTWASGAKMPIYNDNRRLLGNYEARAKVKDEMMNLIENPESIDYILGTMTAGIAPAAMIADKLDKQLIIFFNGEFYKEDKKYKNLPDIYSDSITGIAPWTISSAVKYADEQKKPFMYLREKPKNHGLKKQIEGKIIDGSTTLFLSYPQADEKNINLLNKYLYLLNKLNINVAISYRIANNWVKTNVKNKNVLVIEDLISTGGSSIKEANIVKENGGFVPQLISIFSYELDISKKAFKKANLLSSSVLTYSEILEAMIKKGTIKPKERETLLKWSEDPFGWFNKYLYK